MKFDIYKILGIGGRTYDVLAIITLSAGVNIITTFLMTSNADLKSQSLIITSIPILAGLSFILSGISFSWLTYKMRKYYEVYGKFSTDTAVEKIKNANKEQQFEDHFSVGTICFIIAIILLIILKCQ